MARVIEKGHFTIGEQAPGYAKKYGIDMRCHICDKAVSWRDAEVRQWTNTVWSCHCYQCESGMSSSEFLNQDVPKVSMKVAMKVEKKVEKKVALKVVP